jgi:hypothetical protein
MPNRLALGVAVLALVASADVAWAGSDQPPVFDRNPAEGPPGTAINVSGQGCTLDGRPAQYVHVRGALLHAGVAFDFYDTYDVNGDGSWAGTLSVPTDSPPGQYDLGAACHASDMSWNSLHHDFRVLDPNAPPPTTVPTTTTAARPSSTTTPPTTQTPPHETTTAPTPEPPSTAAPPVASATAAPASTPEPESASSIAPRESEASPLVLLGVAAGLLIVAGAGWRRHRGRSH